MENLCPICRLSTVEYKIEDGRYVIHCGNCNIGESELTSTRILYTDSKEEYKKRRFPELIRLNPTLPRIRHKCTNCGNNILAAITDTITLRRSYICEKCGTSFNSVPKASINLTEPASPSGTAVKTPAITRTKKPAKSPTKPKKKK